MAQAKKNGKQESSIIEIIEEMVKAGESEAKIISTLKDLGVKEEQAKRLLLLGQANTFALLKGEIRKMVLGEVVKERELSKDYVNQLLQSEAKELREESLGGVSGTVGQYSKKMQSAQNSFQILMSKKEREFEGKTNQNLQNLTDLTGAIKEKLNEQGEKLHQMDLDMDEVRLKGLGTKNRLTRLTLLMLGLVFSFTTLYLMVAKFGSTISVDSLIITIALGLIGVTMLFVSTIV